MITIKELEKLQTLAKLSFTEEEMASFVIKLNNIMKMIDTIRDVDCNDVEPLRSVCDMDQRMRLDEVLITDISDQIFSNIPEKNIELAKEIKCFIVPKVIE